MNSLNKGQAHLHHGNGARSPLPPSEAGKTGCRIPRWTPFRHKPAGATMKPSEGPSPGGSGHFPGTPTAEGNRHHAGNAHLAHFDWRRRPKSAHRGAISSFFLHSWHTSESAPFLRKGSENLSGSRNPKAQCFSDRPTGSPQSASGFLPDISTCRTASSMAPAWEAETMETVFQSPLFRSSSSTSTLPGFHIYPSPCSMLRSG